MEIQPDVCPTGILIDIELQSKSFRNITKKNEKIRASIKNKKEEAIAGVTKSSNSWSTGSLLDQSPPRPLPMAQVNEFFTPKSKLKTPSPKSMKIISREASRIVDQLYASPINCSEAMLHDEVFPTVKSLDDAYLDDFHIKSKNIPSKEMSLNHEKVGRGNPGSPDLSKCTVSSVTSCTSSDFVSDGKLSKMSHCDIKASVEQNCISVNEVEAKKEEPEDACNLKKSDETLSKVSQSDIKSPIEQDCISGNIVETKTPENACNLKKSDENLSKGSQSDIKSPKEHDCISGNSVETIMPENECNSKPFVELYASDKDKVKCIVNSGPVQENANIDKHKATRLKILPKFAKGFGFKVSSEHLDKNKENLLPSNGTRQAKYELKVAKEVNSCSSIEEKPKETKIRSSKVLRNEFMVEKFSKENITPKCLVLEENSEENQNLSDSSKKPQVLVRKSSSFNPSSLRKPSLFSKKDPLCQTGPLRETPVVASPVRRINSFHSGSLRNALPVERKFMPTTNTSSRVLKPKMSLNQFSANDSRLSTPLQFGRFQPTNSSAANPMKRKSLLINPNHSVNHDVKAVSQNPHSSNIKKPAVTSSSRFGLVKKLSTPSSHPKFKNDSLSRKLFP